MDEKTVIVTSDPELNIRYRLAAHIREIAAEIDTEYGYRYSQGAYMAANAIDPDVEDWNA